MTGLLLFVTMGILSAQNITVTGTVTDADTGEAVPYAYVQIKGTSQGTSTDEMGKYQLSVPSNGVLVFSFVGYTTEEVPVNGRTVVNISMKFDAETLAETIVIGYGTARKISSVVGSASTVRSAAIQNRPSANAADALQGQVAGLQVFSSSGEPMSNVSMRLRGVNSINASNTPLFIMDGTPVSSSIFLTLSSNDIESVSVLKDASSTAIYGSRAANGVVFVTTKKGKRGEASQIQIRGQYGISTLANHKINLMNTDQWFQFIEMIDPSQLENPDFQANKDFAMKHGIDTKWVDYFFSKTAPVYSAEATISGGSEKIDYLLSYNMLSQSGVADFSDMSRYGIRANINANVNSWLKTGLNLNLSYQDYSTTDYARNSWYNPINSSNWFLPWVSPYEVIENPDGSVTFGDERTYIDEMGAWNTKYLQSLQPKNRNYLRLNGGTYFEFTPIRNLTIRAAQGIDSYEWRRSGKVIPEGPFATSANVNEQFQRYYQFTLTNTAEYKFSLDNGKHNFIALIGQEAIMNDDESMSVTVKGITDVRQMNLNNGTTTDKPTWSKSQAVYNSYFSSLSYNLDSKYYLDLTYRIDGSSIFGINKRYAHFYSVGAMWDIKKENFMRGASWVNDLRLKASYGTTGNSGLSSNYLSIGTVAGSSLYNGQTAWAYGNPANPDLTWETLAHGNISINTRLFNFMNVNLDLYHKTTMDMLMEIPWSYTTGHSAGWGNVGNMVNKGIDLELSFDVIQTKDVYFSIGANFNYNKNEITKLFGGRDEFIVANTGLKYEVGMPLGEFFYVEAGPVDPQDGYQTWYDLDGNLTKNYSDSYAKYTGKQRYAPYAGGFQFNFAWKGLSIGADFSWVAGKWSVNNDAYFITNPKFAMDQNQSADLLNIWTTPGQMTTIARYESARQFDTSLLENASFLRLKNLNIGYSLPKHLLNKTGLINGVRVYAIARNLWTLTQYRGYDPEVDSNLQLGVYPNSRQFTVGLEFTF